VDGEVAGSSGPKYPVVNEAKLEEESPQQN
jgi:hypothetical protein